MQENEERTWATFCHLGGIIGSVIISSVGSILGALVIWLLKRNESVFVDEQGKEALNFQITLCLANAALSIIAAIRFGYWSYNNMFFHRGTWDFGKLNDLTIDFSLHTIGILTTVIWIINIVYSIIAAMKANKGIPYRYPLSLRLVK